MAHLHKRRLRLPKRAIIVKSAGIIALSFLALNAAVWAAYRNRTYPNTHIATTKIGSVAYDDLRGIIQKRSVLPAVIRFAHDKTEQTLTSAEVGINEAAGRTIESARQQRSWLPVANLFGTARLSAPVTIDQTVFRQALERLSHTFQINAVDASLVLDGTSVNIQEATPGYQLDSSRLERLVYAAIDTGGNRVQVATLPLEPAIKSEDLQDERSDLDKQLATAVILRYGGKARQATRDEIVLWFVRSGNTYAISAGKVLEYVSKAGSGFGIRVQAPSQVATAITESVTASRGADITLTAMVARKTYGYCVALRGVGTEHLAVLLPKLHSTLDDSRGWSLDGLVTFTYAESGCDFTVWLASADQMPTFGTICDSLWSCRVGNNVILNFDRWQGASTAWNASGGSLDDYRSMVINHEVGHRLGFGHKHCTVAGQPAPVMQQQSINLEGCSFNPWPLPSELAAFKAVLGL